MGCPLYTFKIIPKPLSSHITTKISACIEDHGIRMRNSSYLYGEIFRQSYVEASSDIFHCCLYPLSRLFPCNESLPGSHRLH